MVSAMKPPAMGPTTGPGIGNERDHEERNDATVVPIRGPTLYKAIAVALSFAENISPITPPPTAIGALPTQPAAQNQYKIFSADADDILPRKRSPMNEPVVGAKAHPILNARKKMLLICRT